MKDVEILSHIKSWGEHGFITALNDIKEIGFDGFEADASIVELYEDRMDVFQEILKENMTQLVTLGMWTRFYNAELIEEDVEHILNCVRFAKTNETRIVTVALGSTKLPKGFEIDWKVIAEGLTEAGKRSAKLGVRLAVMPQLGTFVQTDKDLKLIMKKTVAKYVSVCLDTAFFSLQRISIPSFIQKHGRRIAHIHFRDIHIPRAKKPLDRMTIPRVYPLGKGDIAFKRIASALRKSSFSGTISLYLDEPLKDTPRREAQASYEFMEKTLNLIPE